MIFYMVIFDELSPMAAKLSGRYWIQCLLCLLLHGFVGAMFTTTDYGMTTVSTNASNKDGCVCDCRYLMSYAPNMTHEQLQQEIRRIYSELLLDKNNISATVRKRISVPDYRPSAQSIGYVGVLVLVFSIGSIVALDFTTLLKDIKAGVGNMKSLVVKIHYSDRNYQSVNNKSPDSAEMVHLSLSKTSSA